MVTGRVSDERNRESERTVQLTVCPSEMSRCAREAAA